LKVEAVCTNNDCPTVRETGSFVQLLPAERLMPWAKGALDEDGGLVSCPFCYGHVTVVKPARTEALFALGDVIITEQAKRALAFGSTEPSPLNYAFPADVLVRDHISGDFGSVTGEIVDANRKAIAEGASSESWGHILSQYDWNNQTLWIVTARDRTQTTIMLPDEYRG
jgi:hypothetical protein